MATKAAWELKADDTGAFLRCTHCGRRVSAKHFVFADIAYEKCPDCGYEMDMDSMDEELLDRISQEALNEP